MSARNKRNKTDHGTLVTTEIVQPGTLRHQWGETVRFGADAKGRERNERACLRCGLVKITVIPPQGLPWREWRTKTKDIWQGAATPPCLPVGNEVE